MDRSRMIQKPRLGWPSWVHKENLGVGLTQLGQDFSEELMRQEGISQQDFPWQGEDIYHQHSGIWNWRHKGWELSVPPGGDEIQVGESQRRNRCFVIFWLSDQPVGRVWSWRDSWLAMPFIFPRMWTTHSDICILMTNWKRKEFCLLPEGQSTFPLPFYVQYYSGIVQGH